MMMTMVLRAVPKAEAVAEAEAVEKVAREGEAVGEQTEAMVLQAVKKVSREAQTVVETQTSLSRQEKPRDTHAAAVATSIYRRITLP